MLPSINLSNQRASQLDEQLASALVSQLYIQLASLRAIYLTKMCGAYQWGYGGKVLTFRSVRGGVSWLVEKTKTRCFFSSFLEPSSISLQQETNKTHKLLSCDLITSDSIDNQVSYLFFFPPQRLVIIILLSLMKLEHSAGHILLLHVYLVCLSLFKAGGKKTHLELVKFLKKLPEPTSN